MGDRAKRAKKLVKRAAKGEVMTRALFAECEGLGVKVLPAVAVSRDHTRSRCSHHLNVEELRELILAVLDDKPTSRYFELENKGAIRHVMCLHLTDCDASVAELRGVVPDPVVLRVSRSVSEGGFLPRYLLSETTDSEDTAPSAQTGDFTQYAHSEGTLRAWLYPLPLSEEAAASSEVTELAVTEEERAAADSPPEEEFGDVDQEPGSKRVRLDVQDFNAVKGSHGWAVSEAATAAGLLQGVPVGFLGISWQRASR